MYDISVIVPVYNGEKYLAESLGNLLNQTKKEIEIILVNDASTDGSLRILKDAKNAFGDRIKVIDKKKNEGPGAARNDALAICTGEYVGFMDCDDLVDPTMYEKLYLEAKRTGADIVDCAFFRDSTGLASIHFDKNCIGELDNKKRSTLISCGGYNCTKIFKRSFLVENEMVFRPVYALEDADFMVKAIIRAKSTAAVEEVLYRYKDTEGSLSKEKRFEEYVGVQFEAMEAIYKVAKDCEDYEGIRDAVEYEILCMYKNIAVMAVTTLQKNIRPKEEIEEIFAKVKDKRFEIVRKKPKNNRFVRNILDKEDLKLIDIVDKNNSLTNLF